MISTKFIYKSYIFNICINIIWHEITYNGCYTTKHLGSPTCKILGTILSIDKRGIQIDQKTRKIMTLLHLRDDKERPCVKKQTLMISKGRKLFIKVLTGQFLKYFQSVFLFCQINSRIGVAYTFILVKLRQIRSILMTITSTFTMFYSLKNI